MKCCVMDRQTGAFIGYTYNGISSDCWTIVPNNATRFKNMREARKARSYMSKVCKIKVRDLIIYDDKTVSKFR